MLFTYPFKRHSLQDLHTSVRTFIRALHRGGLASENFNIEDCCTGELLVRARLGEQLRNKLKAFYDAWFQLTIQERWQVRRAFVLTNRIRYQVNGRAPRIPLDNLPGVIRAPAHELFVHLYESSLTKPRCKAHWKDIYSLLPLKVCPFCGIEILHHPDLLKQDYDHLLCKKNYPFAAVNLVNLVPCGRDCNQIFKHEKDVIWNESEGRRRRAFFPFQDHGQTITIDLSGSRLPQSIDDPGVWKIAIGPRIEEIQTWADVFELEKRYRLDIFPNYYDRWRKDFRNWVAPGHLPEGGWDHASIRCEMIAYVQTLQDKRIEDHRFLKLALFQFLIGENNCSFFAALAAEINAQPRN